VLANQRLIFLGWKEEFTMKVREVMTQFAVCCVPETNVGSAVELMWNRNVGMLPVVDIDGKLIGVATDRDICIALGTRNQLAGELKLGDIAIRKVFTCKPNDDVHEALSLMGSHKVRRLPVVNDQGVLQGVLSIDDLVVHSEVGKLRGACELSSEQVASALKKVYGLGQPLMRAEASKAAVN
jgi:CBS domain-containing protein